MPKVDSRFAAAWLLLSLFFHASCGAQSREPASPLREFRDARGKTIQARVLQVRGDEVTIQRQDGQQFTVKISLFSEPDQQYLREFGRPATAPAKSVAGGSRASGSAPGGTGTETRVAESSAEDSWPRFRGPGGMGSSSARGLPLEWSASENIAWKTPLPGPGASSPITYGSQIYLTCYSGYFVPGQPGGSLDQLQRHLLALDRKTGRIVWQKDVAAKLPEEESIRDHGYAANTPAADAERVYAFFGKSGVFAFDHQGQQLWQADVGSGTSGWGTAASPLLYKDLVIINASVESEALVALDRQSGQQRWRADGIRESWNTPILVTADSGRQELVVARHGDILAFDPDTGEPLWSCKTDITWYMVPTLVAADGVVYCLGGRSGNAALAVRAGGSGDVTATHRLWTSKQGSNVTSPIYLDGHLYWMSDQLGIACCAKADSGELVYQERLSRAGQVYASPIVAEGRLYYLTRNGRVFVLAAKPQFEQLAANDLDDRTRFDGSPAVDGNRLLIRSEKFLYCVGQ
ncbi:MAG: PQQ-binding-like beta-propeller repeat protein [Pirellulaceae bacterium]|nr:PQQ-binding-like beta-propeller repeat protein [Pirellulaceae bacterium]